MKNLICVTVEILERDTSLRARVTAPSIAAALEREGDGRPERRVHVVFPIDPEGFFVRDSETTVEIPGSAKAA